jgi:hypothetical protein
MLQLVTAVLELYDLLHAFILLLGCTRLNGSLSAESCLLQGVRTTLLLVELGL